MLVLVFAGVRKAQSADPFSLEADNEQDTDSSGGAWGLARITEIYNYYVLNTPVTFDVEAYTVERRESWFAQFGVAEASANGRRENGRDGICGDDAVSSEGSI